MPKNTLYFNILNKLIFSVLFIFFAITIVETNGWNFLAFICALFATHDIFQLIKLIQIQVDVSRAKKSKKDN